MPTIPTPISRAGKKQAQVHAATVKRALAVLAARRSGTSYADLADRMGVSSERVRQLQRKGEAFEAKPNGAAKPAAKAAKPVKAAPKVKAAKPAAKQAKAKPAAKAPAKAAAKAAPKAVRPVLKVARVANKAIATAPTKKAPPPRKLFKKG